jgi:aspartate kinase
MAIKILKFGGTSVGTPEALHLAASIIRTELPQGGVVVVSALAGTTDQILKAVTAAGKGDTTGALEIFGALEARHREMAETLGLGTALAVVWAPLFERLRSLLEGMGLLWETSARAKDAALAIGETLSANLMTALLCGGGLAARLQDAREVMHTDARHGRANPRPDVIRAACGNWKLLLAQGECLVTQGFIGAAPDGATTTLGRGGSDTSATLLGEALDADEVQIWTDVDGVLTADPSLVVSARPIPVMSLREAAALSAFGAKVLHADSLAPVERSRFKLVVANTHRPQASRTEILATLTGRTGGIITSVAYKEGLVCLHFPPARDLDAVFQVASDLQDAGAVRYGLLSTPEGSLLVVRPEHPEALALLAQLAASGLRIERGWSSVALVGEGLRSYPGGALALLATLEQETIGGIFAGGAGISVAFLVPDERLRELIPLLHRLCIEGIRSQGPASPGLAAGPA